MKALAIQPQGFYIDGTFGRGGHARALLAHLHERGRLLAIDQDIEAIEAGKSFAEDSRVELVQANFSVLAELVNERGASGEVNGIVLDLGVSSPQLDDASRGFSFVADGPLDMRMNRSVGISAAEWLATAKEKDIANCLFELGEERHSRRIARKIVETRRASPIQTTRQLAALVEGALPKRYSRIHPATRSFLAIRIYINDELGVLKRTLENAVETLASGGRIAIIAFHSLEDRIVKRFFRNLASPAFDLALASTPSAYRLVTRKPIRPQAEEIERNPRSRSALLRVLERC